MQDNKIEMEEYEEDFGSIDMYIDDFIGFLREQQQKLEMDSISIYVDEEDGGVAIDFFDSKQINNNVGEA